MSQTVDIRGGGAPVGTLKRGRRPEILAPAGNAEMMQAAVENGADAIYFGLDAFNARLRADNFKLTELPETMRWLHERGVRGFVTLNTLIFASELPEAARFLLTCSRAGVDAIIVQDLGLAALAARLVPELPIHASTQMTLTCAESIEAAEVLGLRLERVVAPRENNVRELAKITRATAKELEVFVHGAICVAYSGQCLTSEALGGRSANRGECAQACRLPYDLIVDGEARDLGDVKYLLSPKDLAAYADLDELARAGIASLKIEGRLKSPQYVAATVQSYRAALDQVFGEGTSGSQGTEGTRDDGGSFGKVSLDEGLRQKLEMTFSRGFTGGYLHDTDHQAVVEGRFPKKRGLYLGEVRSVDRRGAVIRLEGPLKPGDGVVFDAGHPEQDEQGGRVYTLEAMPQEKRKGDGQKKWHGHPARDRKPALSGPAATFPRVDATPSSPREVLVTFGSGRVDLRRVKAGDKVWKTSDPEMDRELAASYEGDQIRHRRPVRMTVQGRPGEPLLLIVEDEDGVRVQVEDTEAAEPARQQPLGREALERQLGRLGNTPFVLGELAVETAGDLMVPFSRLNDLRRRAVEALIAARRRRGLGRPAHPGALEQMRAEVQRMDGASPWHGRPARDAAPELRNSPDNQAHRPEKEIDHGRDARATGFDPALGSQTDPSLDRGTGVPPVSLKPGSHGEIQKRQGAYLPHWTADDAIYAITFRLCDSLPNHVLEEYKRERDQLRIQLERYGKPLSSYDAKRLHTLHSEKIETYLDAGAGECWMKHPEVAGLVARSLNFFHGQRYELITWCVMPNHVHVVLKPLNGHELSDILHSWKSYTSKEANKILGRTGAFWQEEYYDHLIRDEEDFLHCIQYVLSNPANAQLTDWKWVGGIEQVLSAVAASDHGRDARATGFDPALSSQKDSSQGSGTGVSPVNTDFGDFAESSSPVCYLDEFDDLSAGTPQLAVLCRTLEQVKAAAQHPGVAAVYVDFEDMRRLREARELIPKRRPDGTSGPLFAPATLRIIKPGEIGFTKLVLQAEPDAVLVRNLASWHFLRQERPDLPLLADYSLNVANDLTAGLLKGHGFAQLTPSYDLNIDQLLDLLGAAPAHWFEVTIHQRLPMFHMEHCVFCRFLSSGTNHTNCGRPCDTHTLALRDRVGYSHPVKADAGCRNTVYNAVPQSASEYLPQLRRSGVEKWRIELIDESAEATRRIIDAYLPALRGEIDGSKLWRALKATSKLGVTRGSLDHD